MSGAREPVVIRALKEKASVVREIAANLKFTYLEEEIPEESDLVLFRFHLTSTDRKILAMRLPVEVYAFRAFFE